MDNSATGEVSRTGKQEAGYISKSNQRHIKRGNSKGHRSINGQCKRKRGLYLDLRVGNHNNRRHPNESGHRKQNGMYLNPGEKKT